MGKMRGLSIRPEGRGDRRRGQALYRLHHPFPTPTYGVGDEVIYPNPGFPIYESQIASPTGGAGALHLREARRLSPSIGPELGAKITEKTKLVILNSPGNPTGGILAKKDLEPSRHPEAASGSLDLRRRRSIRGSATKSRRTRLRRLPGCTKRTIISDGACPRPGRLTGWRIGLRLDPVLSQFVRWVTNTDVRGLAHQASGRRSRRSTSAGRCEKMRRSFLERRYRDRGAS